MAAIQDLAHDASTGATRDLQRIEDIGTIAAETWTNGLNTWRNMRHLVEIAPAGKKKQELLGVVDQMLAGKGINADIRQVQAYAKEVTGSSVFDVDPRSEAALRARAAGAYSMATTEGSAISDEVKWLNRTYLGTAKGPGGTSHLELGEAYWMDVVSNEDWIKSQSMPAGPQQDARRKRAMQSAHVKNKSTRMMDLPTIDPNAAVKRPGADENVEDLREMAASWRNLPGGAATAARLDAEADAKAKETTTLAIESQNLVGSGLAEHQKPESTKRKSQGMIERAVGFGEQESALASISRSLKSTERALADLYAGKGKGGAPSPTTTAKGPK
ncbi:MAG: hypothetical protein EPN91_02800 [Salinibacterium sp.]|nr:MAG: hypothetical protein EPN91_02800 [Salinibacterium sp.]